MNGLGTIGGFKLQVEDRTDQGYGALNDTMNEVLNEALSAPELSGVFSSYNINSPQLDAVLDRTKANRNTFRHRGAPQLSRGAAGFPILARSVRLLTPSRKLSSIE